MNNPHYKDFAVDLALQAGKMIKKNFTLGMQKEWKEDNTPLTVTDQAINDLVIKEVKKQFPEHSILGEEGSHMIKGSEYTWVCDPIDGTIPFSHGIPTSAFSLALTKNGEVILGVTYDPYMDRLFSAEKGKGAYLHRKRIHVSKARTMNGKLISLDKVKSAIGDISGLRKILEDQGAKVISPKSFVYYANLVACGETVAASFGGTNPWDVAAIKIIVEEAGGKCTDLLGGNGRYDKDVKGFMATNGILHDELLNHLNHLATYHP